MVLNQTTAKVQNSHSEHKEQTFPIMKIFSHILLIILVISTYWLIFCSNLYFFPSCCFPLNFFLDKSETQFFVFLGALYVFCSLKFTTYHQRITILSVWLVKICVYQKTFTFLISFPPLPFKFSFTRSKRAQKCSFLDIVP